MLPKRYERLVRDMPNCTSENEIHCFDSAAAAAEKEILLRPCTKVSYKVEASTYPSLSEGNKATFWVKFSSQTVAVKEEYLIYDLVTMISAIGGTMGLCIGFSFNDFSNFVFTYLGLAFEKAKSWHINERQTTRN